MGLDDEEDGIELERETRLKEAPGFGREIREAPEPEPAAEPEPEPQPEPEPEPDDS